MSICIVAKKSETNRMIFSAAGQKYLQKFCFSLSAAVNYCLLLLVSNDGTKQQKIILTWHWLRSDVGNGNLKNKKWEIQNLLKGRCFPFSTASQEWKFCCICKPKVVEPASMPK